MVVPCAFRAISLCHKFTTNHFLLLDTIYIRTQQLHLGIVAAWLAVSIYHIGVDERVECRVTSTVQTRRGKAEPPPTPLVGRFQMLQ
jgi:hypothetical protein